MGVSATTVRALPAAAHDAVHLREDGLIRLPDLDIIAKAAQEQRVVLTFDLDFGDILAMSRAEAPSVIIFPSAKSDTRRREPAVISRDRRLCERTGKWRDHHRRGR
jgi:predicted nuclease of predicted toxin-antitoxin system